jgi:hypothetical protein
MTAARYDQGPGLIPGTTADEPDCRGRRPEETPDA